MRNPEGQLEEVTVSVYAQDGAELHRFAPLQATRVRLVDNVFWVLDREGLTLEWTVPFDVTIKYVGVRVLSLALDGMDTVAPFAGTRNLEFSKDDTMTLILQSKIIVDFTCS